MLNFNFSKRFLKIPGKFLTLWAVLVCTVLISSAYANYASECRELLNTRDQSGNYVYWQKKSTLAISSILKDEVKAKADISDFYRDKYLQDYGNNKNSETLNTFCETERADLETLHAQSRTKNFTGSSSGVCLETLKEACVSPNFRTPILAQKIDVTWTEEKPNVGQAKIVEKIDVQRDEIRSEQSQATEVKDPEEKQAVLAEANLPEPAKAIKVYLGPDLLSRLPGNVINKITGYLNTQAQNDLRLTCTTMAQCVKLVAQRKITLTSNQINGVNLQELLRSQVGIDLKLIVVDEDDHAEAYRQISASKINYFTLMIDENIKNPKSLENLTPKVEGFRYYGDSELAKNISIIPEKYLMSSSKEQLLAAKNMRVLIGLTTLLTNNEALTILANNPNLEGYALALNEPVSLALVEAINTNNEASGKRAIWVAIDNVNANTIGLVKEEDRDKVQDLIDSSDDNFGIDNYGFGLQAEAMMITDLQEAISDLSK